MGLIDVEIGPKEIGDYWNPEKVGDKVEGNIYEFEESMYNNKKQVRINLYLGRDENDEAIMTLLPSHAHLKRYYVNLQEGDYIVVTVKDIIKPKKDGDFPRYKYRVQVDPERKVVWPEENDGSDYEVETVTDDDYYAE